VHEYRARRGRRLGFNVVQLSVHRRYNAPGEQIHPICGWTVRGRSAKKSQLGQDLAAQADDLLPGVRAITGAF
jgi:hypothetical protein